MNQNELNEINEEYNEAETARTIARQAAYEAYDEYDKRRADKDHADVCFRRLLFSLNETYGGNAIFHGISLHWDGSLSRVVLFALRFGRGCR